MGTDIHHQGKWLKRQIEKQGLSNAEFARLAKISRQALQKIFTMYQIGVKRSTMWKIVGALGIADDVEKLGLGHKSEAAGPDSSNPFLEELWVEQVFTDLMRAERFGRLITPSLATRSTTGHEAAIDLNVEPYGEQEVYEVPTIELPVAAGRMVEMPEVEELNDPRLQKYKTFRIRIRGDSMEKKFPDGSLIEFHCLMPEIGDGNGSKLEVGKYYYVQASERATFKTLESFDNESLTFVAINKRKYPQKIVLSRQEISRMAKALAIVELVG